MKIPQIIGLVLTVFGAVFITANIKPVFVGWLVALAGLAILAYSLKKSWLD